MEIRQFTSKELANMTTEQLKNAFLDLTKKRNFSERTIRTVLITEPEYLLDTTIKCFLMHPNDDEIITLRRASACPE